MIDRLLIAVSLAAMANAVYAQAVIGAQVSPEGSAFDPAAVHNRLKPISKAREAPIRSN